MIYVKIMFDLCKDNVLSDNKVTRLKSPPERPVKYIISLKIGWGFFCRLCESGSMSISNRKSKKSILNVPQDKVDTLS